ncbi:hypothetical protein C8R46DRAFT_1094276 [Mycena filopes]|nr:hypothetical protein C8R46DRAFT_1094276 [Mycena filopes]
MSSLAKSASLVITLAGGLIHSFLTLQLAGSWRTLRALDAESELDAWKLDGLRVLWSLLAMYLLAAASVSFIGFFGVLRSKASHVRLYRDCTSADLAFTAFLTVLAALAARAPARAFCEQPELGPLLSVLLTFYPGATGSPDEACERSLEHAALVALASLLALTVVRLHFLLAVGAHYAALVRSQRDSTDGESEGPQRIRLLPLPRGVAAADVVYAPVHCPAAANSLLGTSAEVWVRAPGVEAGASSVYAPLYAPSYLQAQQTPAYMQALAPPRSPPQTGYAPAYVAQSEGDNTITDSEGVLPADAGLLDARVVGTKREWI